MEKIDILLWVVNGGFFIMFGLLWCVWSSLTIRIDKLDEKLTDVDRRLCRLEGAFTSKDCCMLKADHSHKVESA